MREQRIIKQFDLNYRQDKMDMCIRIFRTTQWHSKCGEKLKLMELASGSFIVYFSVGHVQLNGSKGLIGFHLYSDKNKQTNKISNTNS